MIAPFGQIPFNKLIKAGYSTDYMHGMHDAARHPSS
jgi:hypothetical protein